MNYDELEALVVEAKDGWALQRALAPLDEKERANLSVPTQKLYRQLYTGKVAEGASDRLRAVLSRRPGDSWKHWNATPNRNASMALFGVGPLSAVKRRDVHVWHDEAPILDRIIRDRRPEWLNDWIVHDIESDFTQLSFAVLRGWTRDGVCDKPTSDGYYRMFAAYLMRPGLPQKGEVVPPITAQLLADPALLADVEGLFRVESIAFNTNAWLRKGAGPEYETWTEALLKLSAAGRLDRAELLQSALDGLKLDLKQNQLSGFHGFYKRMAPTEAELLRDQAGYIDLLCHPVGHVVKFAIEMLGRIEKTGALDVDPLLLRELPAALTGAGKGNALAALKLLGRIIARRRDRVHEALAVVGEALRHAEPEVQSAALDLLAANGTEMAAGDLTALRDMAPFVAASNRARFAQLFATIDTAPAEAARTPASAPPSRADAPPAYRPLADVRIEESVLRPEDEITPIATVDALIEAALHAVEAVVSPDEVERIVDAISRLGASRPADFATRVAPLLHRLQTVRASNSIVVGTIGVGGALLDLLYTWLTGQLYRTPSEELAYFELEDGFVPIRVHLRTLADRVHRGEARPLLSAPTHRGGWVNPLVWVERLTGAHDMDLDSMDLRLSMLRLAPDNRTEALERMAALPPSLSRIVSFALGGHIRPTRADRGHHAAWITAARCRDPLRDWSEELAPLDLDDQLPDGIRPARYHWRSTHTAHEHGTTRWKVPEFEISVDVEQADLTRRTGGVLGRIAAALGTRNATDWTSLPTAALNRRMDTKRYWSGELNSPWVSQWLSFVWPQNPAAFYMRGATRLMLRTDENSSSWTPSHGWFQPLFQPGRRWREAGHLLVCLGLVGKDADARGLAIDALIEGIELRLFDPALFASTITRLADGGWVKLNRVAEGLMSVLQASPLHASVVVTSIEQWLPKLDLDQNNAFRLLEIIAEGQALTGKMLCDETRNSLQSFAGGGKAAKLAKQLAK